MFDKDDLIFLNILRARKTLSNYEFLSVLRDNFLPFKIEWIYFYIGRYFKDGDINDWKRSLKDDYFLDLILDSYNENEIKSIREEIIQKLEDAYSDFSFIPSETIDKMVYYNFWRQVVKTRDELIQNRDYSESERASEGWNTLHETSRNHSHNNDFCDACESAPCRCSDPIN